MKFRISMGLIVMASLMAVLDQPAEANPVYSFYCITNNNPTSAAIGPYLSVEVSDPGGGQVLFTFGNTSTASSICDVYFDDGALLGIATIDNSDPGVLFFQYANPGNLPGANNATPPFVTTAGFSTDSDPPAFHNGVNPGETLGITFDLKPTMTFADVIDDLASGDLRIGLHVQGIDGVYSESFINYPPPPPIPAPSALLLSGFGVGFCGWLRRRKTL